MTAPQPGGIEVEDQLERRIRKPVDLLCCVLACIEIVLLAVAGIAASAMAGLAGRPYWRNALWAAIAVYAIVQVGALHTSVLTLLITVIAGRAIGLAVRYAAGSASQRPGALEIAGALGAAGLPVTAIRRVRRQGNPSRRYAFTARGDGCGLDVGRVRPGPAGGRCHLPAVPEGAGARAGVTQRPAGGGSRGRAPGPAVLRGRRGGRAHAAAARRGPGRSRSLRAGLRAPRGHDAGPAESRLQRRRAQPDLGCGRPPARPQGHAPEPDRGSHPAHRRWPGHAARPGRRRCSSQRPADPPGPGPAPRRARAFRRAGPRRRLGGGEDERGRPGGGGVAPAAGRAGPPDPQGASAAPCSPSWPAPSSRW